MDLDATIYLDKCNEGLIRDDVSVPLSPKAYAVLLYLFERPGQLVTRAELLDAIWPNLCVVDGVLTNAVREIRRALNDDARQARILMTVHRRGYRFVGEQYLLLCEPGGYTQHPLPRDTAQHIVVNCEHFAGRERECRILSTAWSRAKSGHTTKLVIEGQPGIGKSMLVNHWLCSLAGTAPPAVATTVCVKGRCASPYMSVLDILDQLCRGAEGETICRLAMQIAPTWCLEMPWLTQRGAESLQASGGVLLTEGRMVLEACHLLEAICARWPLIVFIDNAHWCDDASSNLLDTIAQRLPRARLLLLSARQTWCAAPNGIADQETDDEQTSPQRTCLGAFSANDVANYVSSRSGAAVTESIVEAYLAHSGGHPLFLRGLVDQDGGWSRNTATRRLVPKAFARRLSVELAALSDAQRTLLEVASVAITDSFSAAAAASMIERSVTATEAQYCQMAEQGVWLRCLNSRRWPDGTHAQLFRFEHRIYRDLVYSTIPTARRQQLHLLHSQRLESAFGGRVGYIAKNLAYHFARGGDRVRAGVYERLAGKRLAFEVRDLPRGISPQPHMSLVAL